jgi:hypothetical protein
VSWVASSVIEDALNGMFTGFDNFFKATASSTQRLGYWAVEIFWGDVLQLALKSDF